MTIKKVIFLASGHLAGLLLISLFASLWFPLNKSLLVVFETYCALIAPGLIWTWIFWENDNLGTFERIIFSIAISIVFVSLTVFLLTRLGVTMSQSVVYLAIGITVGLGILTKITQIVYTKKKLIF